MESLLLMIIIGIVSMIFGKSKSKQGQSKNKPFSRNVFEDIRSQVKKQLTYNQDWKTVPTNSEQKIEAVQNNQENLKNQYQQLKQQSEGNQFGITIAESKVSNGRVNKEQDDGGLTTLHSDEKTLINGIIWSEILGEPRAKKPYRPRNR